MQCVVYPGSDAVFAMHPDGVDLTGLYPAQTGVVPPTPEGGTPGPPIDIPAPDIVPTPNNFAYQYDQYGRPMDPRRFSGTTAPPVRPPPPVTLPTAPEPPPPEPATPSGGTT